MQEDIPAVVVEGTLNSLGVVRSLAIGGMPIYVLVTSRYCVAGWCRHGRFVKIPQLEGQSLVSSLIALEKRIGPRPVLILTSDRTVETISTHRRQIESLYRISLPPTQIVRTLTDKTSFQTFAAQEGFTVPNGVAVTSTSGWEAVRNLEPPLIIKPSDTSLVQRGIVKRVVKAYTYTEAENEVNRMLAHAPRVIVQEWIEGSDSEIFFTLFSCDDGSNLIGIFSGRKLICDPPEIGNTAICVAAPEEADELYSLTSRFIARVGYRGLGSLEFKRDIRTGRLVIIEPTVGRTDWQEEIATLNGVNLPLLTYWAEIGRPMATKSGNTVIDVAWRSSIEHRVPPGALPPGVRMVDGVFRWSDPVPSVYFYGIERFAARIWRRGERMYRYCGKATRRKTNG